jgi:pyruvate formate lyase activating enzyme
MIFDIKHFAVHDGPGIRTTIFLKGCPLKCAWCHSPESQNQGPELLLDIEKCIQCNICVEVCPESAIPSPGLIDKETCNVCGACAEACYSGAIELKGKPMTIEEVLNEIEKDRELLQNSGGGVTLSGGEPMAQPDFTVELLRHLKQSGYHTALDTSGYTPWGNLEQALGYTDLVLFDLKHICKEKHAKFTGVDNQSILENLAKANSQGKKIWVRVPLVPGVNDDPEHIEELADWVKTLGVERTYLLPYHSLGVPKYESLGRDYGLEIEPHTEDQLGMIKKLVDERLDNVVVMGIE